MIFSKLTRKMMEMMEILDDKMWAAWEAGELAGDDEVWRERNGE